MTTNVNNTISSPLYAQANGVSSSSPFVDIFLPRNPTPNDIGPPYQTQKKWLNTNNGAFFILAGFTCTNGEGLQANWSEITGVSGIGVKTVEGNSGGFVYPSITGNLNILGSGSVTVSGNPSTNTLTISSSALGLTWNNITSSQTLSANNGYFCNSPGGALTLLLPTTSNVGDVVYVTLDGATSWSVTQSAGQQVRFGNQTTTSGAGGSINSTMQGDTIFLVCSVANTRWNEISSQGNLSII